MQVVRFDITYPRWALPGEEIPVHVKIDKEVTAKIKKVVIDLPDGLMLADTINIEKHESESGRITIHRIGKSESSVYDYFGIVIVSKLIDVLKMQIPIPVVFNFHDGTHEKHTAHARIFRPLLEVTNCPQKITITDETNQNIVIPISLKFTGFGDVILRCECRIDGKIVSKGTFVIDEILNRMADAGLTNLSGDVNLSIDPAYVSQLANDMKKMVGEKGMHELLRKHGSDIRTEAQDMTNAKRESFMTVLYKGIEGYLIKILSEILKRNVGSKLQLESQVAIYTQIKLPVTKVSIRISYKDMSGNNYVPIEQAVEIVDRRKNSSGVVEIPLEITDVDETDSFKNVDMMEIVSS